MSKSNSFIKGAAILGIAGGIVKIMGAVYRLPLSNIIGPEGMGYYQTAYPLYTLLLTLSTAGFPVAIAKLVSEKRAIGDFKAAHRVFKVALMGLIIGGILTSAFVFLFSDLIVERLGNSNAYYALIALVPALFFVPIMASFRGFFQGHQNMAPTAISQVVEQFFRVASGLFLTYYLLDRGNAIAAGGASFGGSIGAIFGTLTMFSIYIYNRKHIMDEMKTSIRAEEYKVNQIVKDLLIIAVPITIGSAIMPVMDTIDVAIVLNRLQFIGYTEAEANGLYGNLKGMAQTLINLPQVFSMAIAMSLVPAIAGAKAKMEKAEMENTISSGIRMTLLIGLPAGIGLYVLADPIISLLYFKNTAETILSVGSLLKTLSMGVIFLTLIQTLSSILQGLGRPMIPAINLFIGAGSKVVLSYILTSVPSINIKGAAISTVIAFMIAATLDLIFVIKYSKIDLNVKDVFMRPVLAAMGMGVSAFLAYEFLVKASIIMGRSTKIATVAAILIAAVVYGILLILTGTITSKDLEFMPKGEKIRKALDKLKILK